MDSHSGLWALVTTAAGRGALRQPPPGPACSLGLRPTHPAAAFPAAHTVFGSHLTALQAPRCGCSSRRSSSQSPPTRRRWRSSSAAQRSAARLWGWVKRTAVSVWCGLWRPAPAAARQEHAPGSYYVGRCAAWLHPCLCSRCSLCMFFCISFCPILSSHNAGLAPSPIQTTRHSKMAIRS